MRVDTGSFVYIFNYLVGQFIIKTKLVGKMNDHLLVWSGRWTLGCEGVEEGLRFRRGWMFCVCEQLDLCTWPKTQLLAPLWKDLHVGTCPLMASGTQL